MDLKTYIEEFIKDPVALALKINTLSHAERIDLRLKLEADGCKQLMRNLYFDYDKQVWIDRNPREDSV